jgi:DNA-binding HxlR family transcriptional regulator
VEGETEFLKQIQDGYSVRILIYLLESGKSNRTSLYRLAANSANTAIRKLEVLINFGLVSEVEEPLPPKRKWVELTPKGRQVAEKLAEIEKILGNEK